MGEHLHPSIEGTVGQPLSAPFPKLCLTLIGKSEPVLVILKITAIDQPLLNPSKGFDIDIIDVSKTLATFKVLVLSVRSNLISV